MQSHVINTMAEVLPTGYNVMGAGAGSSRPTPIHCHIAPTVYGREGTPFEMVLTSNKIKARGVDGLNSTWFIPVGELYLGGQRLDPDADGWATIDLQRLPRTTNEKPMKLEAAGGMLPLFYPMAWYNEITRKPKLA